MSSWPGTQSNSPARTSVQPASSLHHAHTAVAGLATGFAARLVAPFQLGDPVPGGSLRCPQGLLDRRINGVILVIPRQDLRNLPATRIVERDEVAHEIEEAAPLEDSLQHHLEL